MVIKTYKGRSNVSGAVALDDHRFIVADDEDNELSIFHQNKTKALQPPIVLSKVFNGEIKDGKKEEIDLEGATRIGDVYLWIGSHSTNSESKARPARHRLFGIQITEIEPCSFSAKRYGSIYTQLIANLKQDTRFTRCRFHQAEGIAPKDHGGLSIEGLAATPEQGLMIGFRNPLIDDKALLVHLLNPLALLLGQAPLFGDPIELNLDGLGIRDITWRRGHEYLIVAGPYHMNEHRREKHRLYAWNSVSGQLTAHSHIDLNKLNIEAAFFFPDEDDRVVLLSDDGDLNGFQCLGVAL